MMGPFGRLEGDEWKDEVEAAKMFTSWLQYCFWLLVWGVAWVIGIALILLVAAVVRMVL